MFKCIYCSTGMHPQCNAMLSSFRSPRCVKTGQAPRPRRRSVQRSDLELLKMNTFRSTLLLTCCIFLVPSLPEGTLTATLPCKRPSRPFPQSRGNGSLPNGFGKKTRFKAEQDPNSLAIAKHTNKANTIERMLGARAFAAHHSPDMPANRPGAPFLKQP